MNVGNSLNVDGSITASGRLGGGEQAVSAGDAVLLGSDGKIPISLIDVEDAPYTYTESTNKVEVPRDGDHN